MCTSDGLSNPEGIVFEHDTVIYSCQIKYQGRWAPMQIWTDTDGNELSPNVGDGNVEGSSVHTYISFAAKVSDDGQQLKCQTTFGELTPNPPGENEDHTIPSYDNVTAFQTLIVHCKYFIVINNISNIVLKIPVQTEEQYTVFNIDFFKCVKIGCAEVCLSVRVQCCVLTTHSQCFVFGAL